MRGVNEVTLIGFIGKEPEARYLNDVKRLKFSLATSDKINTKEGLKEVTEWHRCIMWGEMAKNGEIYLHKGCMVYVKGKLKYRSFADSEGKQRYMTEIEVKEWRILRGNERVDNHEEPEQSDDDLPF